MNPPKGARFSVCRGSLGKHTTQLCTPNRNVLASVFVWRDCDIPPAATPAIFFLFRGKPGLPFPILRVPLRYSTYSSFVRGSSRPPFSMATSSLFCVIAFCWDGLLVATPTTAERVCWFPKHGHARQAYNPDCDRCRTAGHPASKTGRLVPQLLLSHMFK